MLALTISGQTSHIPESGQDAALQRYWIARQSGDKTARLVRMVESPNGDNDDDPEPTPTPAGVVSPLARDRVERQDAFLAKAGFAALPPLYAPGSRVRPLGDQNFALKRRAFGALPSFLSASGELRAQIASENRQDEEVELDHVFMNRDGSLGVFHDDSLLEPSAFHQLANLGGFGLGARYLANNCEPDLRASNVNTQLAKAKNRKIKLRIRRGPSGKRHVYAVVTPTYATVDTDDVLKVVEPELLDAKAEIYYDGSGVRATALFMPDKIVDLAAGDVFKVGVRIETDDTGHGRIKISGVVWRNLCLNLIIIGKGEVETVSQVHRGDPERILDTVAKGVQEARARVADFLEAWGHARTVRVEPSKLFKQWVEERRLGIAGRLTPERRDQAVEALLTAWEKEPGETLADAVNAVTRAAHETPNFDQMLRESMERQAAELIMVPR